MSDNCIKDCPLCKGYGWLRHDVPLGHPEFGKMFECPNRKYRFWDDTTNITLTEARDLDWDKFTQTKAVTEMKEAFLKLIGQGYGWLYIHGQPGNGKTIMAKTSVIYALMMMNIKGEYVRLSSLMNELRSMYDEAKGQLAYKTRLEYYGTIPYLVIDEIGRDRQSEFSKQSLSDIMDMRYMLATNKQCMTVWVSNFKPEEVLESYQVDRVRDGRFSVLQITSNSVRPAMTYKDTDDELPWWQK